MSGVGAPIWVPAWGSGPVLLVDRGLACPATAVSHSAIAALPCESMQQLIWLRGLQKMKYDLVVTALQHPSPSQLFKMMNKLSKSHLRVIITGNVAGPLPTT